MYFSAVSATPSRDSSQHELAPNLGLYRPVILASYELSLLFLSLFLSFSFLERSGVTALASHFHRSLDSHCNGNAPRVSPYHRAKNQRTKINCNDFAGIKIGKRKTKIKKNRARPKMQYNQKVGNFSRDNKLEIEDIFSFLELRLPL